MLIPHDTTKVKGEMPSSFYICDKCGGKHFYFGSAEATSLDKCSICLNKKGWCTDIGTGSCIHLTGGLVVVRNNPDPFKRS